MTEQNKEFSTALDSIRQAQEDMKRAVAELNFLPPDLKRACREAHALEFNSALSAFTSALAEYETLRSLANEAMQVELQGGNGAAWLEGIARNLLRLSAVMKEERRAHRDYGLLSSVEEVLNAHESRSEKAGPEATLEMVNALAALKIVCDLVKGLDALPNRAKAEADSEPSDEAIHNFLENEYGNRGEHE